MFRLVLVLSVFLAAAPQGLQAQDPSVQKHIEALRSKEELSMLKTEEGAGRQRAAEALARLGPAAKEAVPALIDTLRVDRNIYVRKAIAEALVNVGPEATSALKEAAGDSAHMVRVTAARVLFETNVERDRQYRRLLGLLEDGVDMVRMAAARAFGELGPSAKAAVPALRDALKDKDYLVRDDAAWALGKMGPEAKSAVPDLIAALKDKESLVRLSAVQALGNVGPAAKAAVPALTEVGKEDDRIIPGAVAAALEKIQPKPKQPYGFESGVPLDDPTVFAKLAEAHYGKLAKLGIERGSALLTSLAPVERGDLILMLGQEPQNVRKFLVSRDLIRKWTKDPASKEDSKEFDLKYAYSIEEQMTILQKMAEFGAQTDGNKGGNPK